jgi:hypothetical protein
VNNPDSPADKYIGELKLWGIRVVAVLVLSLLTVLLQRWGVPVHVDPPPPAPINVIVKPGPDPSDPFTGAKAFAIPVTVEERK